MKLLRKRADGRLWVKLCGFRDPDLASLAAAEGADAIGVVLHEGSPRNCSLTTAADIVAVVAPVPVVAVVVDRSRTELEEIVRATGVAGVQLCGSETAGDVAWLHRSFPGLGVIRAHRVAPGVAVEGRFDSDGADAVLIDAAVEGLHGGTGIRLRWAGPVEADVPVILAGGLDASNIADVRAAARPFGVDVSSALEVERGEKDPARIRAFMDAVRAAVPA